MTHKVRPGTLWDAADAAENMPRPGVPSGAGRGTLGPEGAPSRAEKNGRPIVWRTLRRGLD